MRKAVIILIIVIFVVAGFVGWTVYQGLQLKKTFETGSVDITQDIESLVGGDCSKLKDIENTIAEIKSGCKNPALKYIIEKKAAEMWQENICKEINNPNNEYIIELEEIKKNCGVED